MLLLLLSLSVNKSHLQVMLRQSNKILDTKNEINLEIINFEVSKRLTSLSRLKHVACIENIEGYYENKKDNQKIRKTDFCKFWQNITKTTIFVLSRV